MLYGHGRHENEYFAYDFWSYPYLKRGGCRQDRATRFAIVVKCALRGSRRSPFSILQFRRDCLALFCSQIMDDGLSQVLKKSGEARLYKLKKFVLFGASTVDHNTSSRRFFVRRDLNRKRLEWSRCDGEFIRGRNLRQASKIAKSVRRQI